MGCSGQYATASDFNQFWCLTLDLTDATTLAEVNSVLTIAASDVQSALAAVGACNCDASAAWVVQYLKKLNLIDAAVVYNCSCGPQLAPEVRRMWLEWLSTQFEQIRTQKIDICGLTGADYIAFGAAENNLTAWSGAQIITNRIRRLGY